MGLQRVGHDWAIDTLVHFKQQNTAPSAGKHMQQGDSLLVETQSENSQFEISLGSFLQS